MTSSTNETSRITAFTLEEHPIRQHAKSTIYTFKEKDQSWSISKISKNEDEKVEESTTISSQSLVYTNVIAHFLPANYPSSVSKGYGRFAALGFLASVAGSAAMVLSTQTLLLAVGIVGQQSSASIMAGALNWVLKDGVGQLGGVWFASYMGRRTSQFDASPKYWRMVSALALDGATLLEITSPLFPTSWVLAIASIANIGKNIGFLTASASRAALHQSLASSANLGDLTAKAGSQSMVASVLGTALGIGLSPVLGDVPHFVMGFMGLSVIHQGCNYLSLKAVPLSHLDRHRLHLVLEAYVKDGLVLDPSQVANQESFLPLLSPDDAHTWLTLGSSITEMGGPAAVQELLDPDQPYILAHFEKRLHLVFTHDSSAADLVQGMYHAYWLHYKGGHPPRRFHELWNELEHKGWNLEAQLLRIEPAKAVRIDYSVTKVQ